MNLPPRLLPAPLEGVMHPAFCRAVAALRLVDGWVTPFWRVSTGVPRRRHLQDFLAPFQLAEVPVRAQLMGTDPELIAAVAERFLELGAVGINLNFACPSRQVTSGCAGGGALRHPERMLAIVGRLRERLPEAELSVKIRTGWTDPAECQAWLPALVAAGRLDWLAVHFRTVQEQYGAVADGVARWRAVIAAVRPLPVWINGDLSSRVAAEQAMAAVGAAGAMAGRGWLRDPWWFRRDGGAAVPEPEAGRELFFAAVRDSGVALSGGQTIELGKWLFGRILR